MSPQAHSGKGNSRTRSYLGPVEIPPDRRQFRRCTIEAAAEIRCQAWCQVAATVVNISLGGLYLNCDRELLSGQRIEVRLGRGLFLTGQVLRSEKCSSESWGGAIRLNFGDPLSPFSGEKIFHLMHAFQVSSKPIDQRAFTYYRRLNRLWDRVQRVGTRDLTLAEAADLATMEKTYFSYFFHQKVGVTFSRWVQYLRIEKALELLAQQNHSVTEIAFVSGFRDLSAFQKAFKKWTNLSPRVYKSIVRPL